MADTWGRGTKLLFILSGDFGELATAMYFTMGQSLDAVLAMPPELFVLHSEHLRLPSHSYRTPSDIFAILNHENPEVVLLFSGYLLGLNGLVTLDALRSILNELRVRGCRVVTSDPFLGLMAAVKPSTFSNSHARRASLLQHFGKVSRLVRGTIHLYMAHFESVIGLAPTVSFFNEHVILSRGDLAQLQFELGYRMNLEPQRRRWLFVLSQEDYALQCGLNGRDGFHALLRRKLQEAGRADRQPVLIASEACTSSLAPMAQEIEDSVLLTFCNYELFRMLTLEAEYCFYWNIFSNSVFPRVANELPVFFFHEGHLAWAMPPLCSLGMRTYYGDAPIPHVRLASDLNESALLDLATKQRRPLQRAMAAYRGLLNPSQVVQWVMEQ